MLRSGLKEVNRYMYLQIFTQHRHPRGNDSQIRAYDPRNNWLFNPIVNPNPNSGCGTRRGISAEEGAFWAMVSHQPGNRIQSHVYHPHPTAFGDGICMRESPTAFYTCARQRSGRRHKLAVFVISAPRSRARAVWVRNGECENGGGSFCQRKRRLGNAMPCRTQPQTAR